MLRLRFALVAVAATLGLMGAAAAGAGRGANPPPVTGTKPPTKLWYHYAVVAKFERTIVDVGRGEPSERIADVLTVAWNAWSEAATILTHDEGDVSLAAGMVGTVTDYGETNDYNGFYSTIDPKNPANHLQKPCTETRDVEMVDPGHAFDGILAGTARTGMLFRLTGSFPKVKIITTSTSDCTDDPRLPLKIPGSREALLYSHDRNNQLVVPQRKIQFGRTFSHTVTSRYNPGPYPFGSYDREFSWKLTARITFFRCPGSTPCARSKVPARAFRPLK